MSTTQQANTDTKKEATHLTGAQKSRRLQVVAIVLTAMGLAVGCPSTSENAMQSRKIKKPLAECRKAVRLLHISNGMIPASSIDSIFAQFCKAADDGVYRWGSEFETLLEEFCESVKFYRTKLNNINFKSPEALALKEQRYEEINAKGMKLLEYLERKERPWYYFPWLSAFW